MAHITKIEGIGDTFAEKLGNVGIKSTDDLLTRAADKRGRETVATATGISEVVLLKWVNQADLQRVKGVGEEYGELLERSGVDSVPELAQRNAANLAAKMVEVNKTLNLTGSVPGEATVASWITHAKSLEKVVTH
jgi:predicted flap endonuclease-1-like 5' DNA nuclease